MTTLATPAMAAYCLSVVYAQLRHLPAPPVPPSIPNDPQPIFVTYDTLPRDSLRGCIGNFSPAPLQKQLTDYAKVAAFEDTRFKPISLEELPQLKCTVSLLHSFEPCSAWDDWVIGTHGIRIRYKGYGATYLPSVAAEQGWDHAQTMRSLLAKGGYRGTVDSGVLAEVSVTRYQVALASAKFADLPIAKQP